MKVQSCFPPRLTNRHADEPEVIRILEARLRRLPFSAFLAFVSDVLTATGYRDVLPAPRHQHFKGRNQEGGYDLSAFLPGGTVESEAEGGNGVLGGRRSLVQVKQYGSAQSVPQKYVDQLRGVCLREGASEGLLVTTGVFAPPARQNAEGSQRMAVVPIRLMDREMLFALALQHWIGVRRSDRGNFVLDSADFDRLHQREKGNLGRKVGKVTDLDDASASRKTNSCPTFGNGGCRNIPRTPGKAYGESSRVPLVTQVTVTIGRINGASNQPRHGTGESDNSEQAW
jgi:hypothetical protein